MSWSKDNVRHMLNGILFVVLFSLAAMELAALPVIKNLGLSPLIIGILIGMIYANTLRSHAPREWGSGISFSAKTILRISVVFFGFHVTFQDIASVGLDGILVSVLMVTTTFLLGAFLGQKVFKLDRDTSLLTASGSAVCGAAAVLATEPVLKAEAYKSAIAVSTVVIFGTLSMFLYPIIYKTGILHVDQTHFGLYAGGSIHEVAQVIGATNPAGKQAMDVGVIVKLTRVMLLSPLLVILGVILSALARRKKNGEATGKTKIVVPWFAILFIVASGINSLNIIPKPVVDVILMLDTFLLTMAMTALGLETSAAKFRQAGLRPFLLALALWVWLLVGGYGVMQLVTTVIKV
ncbi:MAG: YeiH family putative sulfate export transporter [Spirochaetales bacterium]|nr:YeiH family putative sulfate export transporter [Spirochaetales bacterium]